MVRKKTRSRIFKTAIPEMKCRKPPNAFVEESSSAAIGESFEEIHCA
jgi:hypothetical protein